MNLRRRRPGPRLAVALAVTVQAASAAGHPRLDAPLEFHRISLEQGLSQSSISCLLEDSRGFLWVGTEYGLNRWDGYTFTVLTHDPEDSHSLAANKVLALAEDREGRIWVATENHGLDELDPGRETFTHYVHAAEDPTSLPSDTVNALLADREGTLWIGTPDGLVRRVATNGAFETPQRDRAPPGSPSYGRVTTLHQGPSGTLWTGTDTGLHRVDTSTGTMARVRLGIEKVHVAAIVEAPDETLWVGTHGSGLLQLDPRSGNVSRFLSDPRDPTTLSSDEIASLCLDDLGTLWIGTEGFGLNRLDPATGQVRRIPYNTDAPHGDPSANIPELLLGRSSILWIGTALSGLVKLDLKGNPFRHFHTTGVGALRLDVNPVFSVLEDSHQELWVGLSRGVQRIDQAKGLSRRFDPGGHRLSALSVPVYAIHEDRLGFVWLGTWRKGLVRVDPSRRDVVVYRHDAGDPASLASDSVFAVHEDRSGRLWVGTVGGGLDLFDRATGSFVHHRAGRGPPDLSHDVVRAIIDDSRGLLWVGTIGGGVSVRDPATGAFSWFVADPEKPGTLSDNAVAALHEDRTGTVWVATAAGLNRFDRATGTFERFRVRDGLPSDAVTGVLDDARGRIWVAHFRGLSCLDPETNTFTNFDASHGLQSNEFNSAAVATGHHGEMYFGGVNGLTAFSPDEVGRNSTAPLVSITSVRAYDEKLSIVSSPHGERGVRLHHSQDFLSFDFVGIELTAPERIRYSYMLEGLDRGWGEGGARRHASYAHVPPGHYVFRVKACNNDGVWSENGDSLAIEIAPPWWETAPARGAAAALLVLLMFLVVEWRTRRLRLRLAEQERVEAIVRHSRDQLASANLELENYSSRLESMVQERTAQLAEANEELRTLAASDTLTGLANRRRLVEFVESEWRRAHRFGRPLAMIMADIDSFKAYNDRNGHQAGDECLRRVAQALASVVSRPGDLLARWGGEEFITVLSDTTLGPATTLAERMRTAIEALAISHEGVPSGCVTASFGVAAAIPAEVSGWNHLLAAADRALYLAKAGGRNRVATEGQGVPGTGDAGHRI